MEESEVVAIAYAGDSPEETSLSKKGRVDVTGIGDASEVSAVEVNHEQGGGGEQHGGDQVAGLGVVPPVGGIERVGPCDRFVAVMFVLRGLARPWWPSHGGVLLGSS
jgi:hypothetical protein